MTPEPAPARPVTSLLVANRGEIARRIMRTARVMGITTVAVHSDADARSLHVAEADLAVHLPGVAPTDTYLRHDLLLDAARRSGADAVHPGYGFLSESGDFARAVTGAGLVWVGPPADAIDAMGSKIGAKDMMRAAGVATLPSVTVDGDEPPDPDQVASLGWPLLVKASAGGGGRGMRIVGSPDELVDALAGARREAASAFGDGTVFLERYITAPRHIEVQVLADAHGDVVALFERECSIQRRHQKIIEEAPSPVVGPELRARLSEAAVAAARAVGYVNAGTVEFIYSRGEFFFLEMNARLQVEHPVTELVYGVDLVVEQLRIAAGEELRLRQEDLVPSGHAIECRVNAERYAKNFMPSPGQVTGYHEPSGPGVRVDSSLVAPGMVSPHYDPLVAKLICWGQTREMATARMRRALVEYAITGISTNIDYHLAILDDPDFVSGAYTTHFIDGHPQLVEAAQEWEERRRPFQRVLRDPARAAAIAAAVAVGP